MPARRSCLGCEECRRRRRKCDEGQPVCGPCSVFDRKCDYTLKIKWGAVRTSRATATTDERHRRQKRAAESTKSQEVEEKAPAPSPAGPETAIILPQSLPNGISLPPRYQRLLNYFTEDILASLSVHPSIHADLRRGLVPVALESPHLLSACLALAAAGFRSRGIHDIDGTDVSRILDHLQSSGLALLRSTLGSGQPSTALLATCLIWCLADVFASRQGTTSWRVHLRGIKALISTNAAYSRFQSGAQSEVTAMRHLYRLYLALETLPYVPAWEEHEQLSSSDSGKETEEEDVDKEEQIDDSPCIDGFLGYSEELLYVLRDIDRMAITTHPRLLGRQAEADTLLTKLKRMIRRDEEAAPRVLIATSLSPEQANEFLLCHRTFQQATLVHIYRRLYRMPSSSAPIRRAVDRMEAMVGEMTQDRSCHTWVAMAMPLFTMGCEAFTTEQQGFVLEKIAKFDACLGSLHVGIMRKALEDMWRIREELEDVDGHHCASELLEKLEYNIILF